MSVIETSPVIFPYEHPIGAAIEAMAVRRLHHLDGLISSPKTNAAYSTRSTETLVLDDIDALRSLTARFSRRLNQLRCPILRLPPEIIQLVIHAYIRLLDEQYFIKRTQKWIQLGHVCHNFRTILFGMHALWAKNVFAPDMTIAANDKFLERAHDAPITINLHWSSSMARLELALQHLRRAREIDVSGVDHMQLLVPGLDGQCLPLLDTLKLDQRIDSISSAQLVSLIPHTFTALNLRHLSFTNIFMHSAERWPTNLTTLKLHRSFDVSHLNLPSADVFLDSLRLCSNLRELDLKGYIPNLDLAQLFESGRNKFISLPLLMMLTIEQDRISTLQLWRILTIPPSAQLKISWGNSWSDSGPGPLMAHIEDTRAFLAHVSTHDTLMPPVSALQIFGIQSDEDNWICFNLLGPYCGTGHVHRLDLSETEWTCIAGFTLSTDFWTGAELASAIARFSSIYQLAQIPYLSVDSDIGECLREAGQLPVYASFKAVQTLHLSYCKSRDAYTPLGDRHLSDSPSSTPTVLCPVLKTLFISDNGASDDIEGFRFSVLRSSLAATLSKRVELGVPVRRLGLAYRTVTEFDRDRLSEYVEEICTER